MIPGPILSFNILGNTYEIHMYGILIAIGILAAVKVLYTYSRKNKISEKFIDFTFYNGLFSTFFGFLSATIFQGLYNYIKNPENGFILNEGFTFLGGLIGGTISFLIIYNIFKNKYKEKLSDIISILPCSILIAHAFGRIGCFFAGCCYGNTTNSIFGIQFPGLTEKVLPTQLFEAIFLFILFAVCSYLYLKNNNKNNLIIYTISYGTFRFLIEFLRGDDRGMLFNTFLSPSQIWSIILILIGIILIFFNKNIKEKNT